MDKLIFATRALSLGDETKQDDHTLVTDIERLINIVSSLVDSMEDFILEVHVSPMNMLQAKFSDIKKLKFSIVYNGHYTGDELKEKKEECSGLIEAFTSDEFEGIESVDKTDYSLTDNWGYPTLVLYSVFGSVKMDDINPHDLTVIKRICEDGYAVSLPASYPFQDTKGIIIHCNDGIAYPRLIGAMLNADRYYGQAITEYKVEKKYSKGLYYIPMIGIKPIKYNIPYTLFTLSDFETQEISEELKE